MIDKHDQKIGIKDYRRGNDDALKVSACTHRVKKPVKVVMHRKPDAPEPAPNPAWLRNCNWYKYMHEINIYGRYKNRKAAQMAIDAWRAANKSGKYVCPSSEEYEPEIVDSRKGSVDTIQHPANRGRVLVTSNTDTK